ncbi:MAG: carbohydrate-binding domain-containing protein [Chloroflexi bacterium]|nr:carbohydrate-binding domain-containing protein [Chloroflexota bacterium]
MSYIALNGDSVSFDGSGAVVYGNIVTITSEGIYSISGALKDGRIIVYTTGMVRLILNGASIACSTSAAIFVKNAEKTVITLADGTENYVTDGDSYAPPSDEPSAAIFSKDDLTINGGGSLTVNGRYNNGIASKDDLKITGGNITVNAVNDGIKGRDCLAIKDGNITVNAGGDGLQSDNDVDPERGFVWIEGGTISITAGDEGIQAEAKVIISGGAITVCSTAGSLK